ncbi:uncharacterized protein LOC114945461 isoform X2 [Nylanderia fulva]|nr:uncharacterized protein LOC114945461 isoform X2 [Nylanderia fulva]
MIRIMPWKDFVFSSNSLYEGLLMVYRVSSDETKEQLKSILKLPIHLGTKFWALDRIVKKREKKMFQVTGMKECFCSEHSCWINDTKLYKNNKYITPENYKLFNCSNMYKVINDINEKLKSEMQAYISQPVIFNTINNNMELILSYGLWFKDNRFVETKYKGTYISHELSMFMTKIVFVNGMCMIMLFPAVQEDIIANKYTIGEDISGLVERLTTEKGVHTFCNMLTDRELKEMLPEEYTVYPDVFELEYELPIDQLFEMLDIKHVLSPENASLFGFTEENLHLGGAYHRAYIKFTLKNATANAINVFFTKSGGSLTSLQEPSNCTHNQCKKSFVWLIYSDSKRSILFTGVVNKNC